MYSVEEEEVTLVATKKSDIREHAKELAKLGARKGGQARAAVLTPQERREIARQAVMVRWRKQKGEDYQPVSGAASVNAAAKKPAAAKAPQEGIPRSLYQGTLRIGELELECHVLSDGKRVFAGDEVAAANPGAREGVNLNTFLARVPMTADGPVHGPDVHYMAPRARTPRPGYEATYLVEIANAYLKARDEGRLTPVQVPLAKHAATITRALAKVGITALIDSATGFEQVRLKRTLQLELQAFIAHDIQEWALTFPEEFWSELARLEGVRYSPRSRPLRWGRYVMLFVYDAIDQDVEARLKVAKPDLHFRADHRRWLEEFSKEQLNRHLQQIVVTMKRCRDMDEFRLKLERVFKRVPTEVGFPQAV
jgi:hypothetical protein